MAWQFADMASIRLESQSIGLYSPVGWPERYDAYHDGRPLGGAWLEGNVAVRSPILGQYMCNRGRYTALALPSSRTVWGTESYAIHMYDEIEHRWHGRSTIMYVR